MPRPHARLSAHSLFCLLTVVRAAGAFRLVSPWGRRYPHSTRPIATATPTFVSASKAGDFTIQIPDVSLPDEPLRHVRVLDTGLPSSNPGTASVPPPLVLIGGTAQTIASWVGHIHGLSRKRRLIVYETRGQGRTTDLDLSDASLAVHVEDFCRVHAALKIEGPVDLCGFSFGGRVSLGVAALHPGLVRRLVLTGVPAERDAVGRLIIKSWRAALDRGMLQEFVWNSMLHCHGAAFLSKYESKIPEWVAFVESANTVAGLRAMVARSHTSDVEDPYHTLQLAPRVEAPTLLLGALDDKVATALEIKRLAEAGRRGWPVHFFPGAGHNCVFEAAVLWREEVLAFLDAEEGKGGRV